MPLHLKSATRTAIDARGRAVTELLVHPLPDLAADHYLKTPLEGRVILSFLNEHLRRLKEKDEESCPVDDDSLRTWVHAALNYGVILAAKERNAVFDIFAETGAIKLHS